MSERLAYEKAVHHQRLRTEISQAKREADFFKANVEKSKRMGRKRPRESPESPNPAKRVYDFRQKETDSSIRKSKQQKNSSNNSSSNNIRPSILKQRDSSRDEGYHSSKLRDKSRSPSRGATCSPPENINEVVFSGKKLLK